LFHAIFLISYLFLLTDIIHEFLSKKLHSKSKSSLPNLQESTSHPISYAN
jgi:hypothetical protein